MTRVVRRRGSRSDPGSAATRSERGSAAVELTLAVPAMMIILALLVAGGRLWFARSSVADAAYSGARSASLARTAGEARSGAENAASRSLDTAGLRCASRTVAVDTAGFAVPVGTPATVGTAVTCVVPFADLTLPGMPGSITLRAVGSSALDTYRGRE
jgi:Flp pilus assembly protein TadG